MTSPDAIRLWLIADRDASRRTANLRESSHSATPAARTEATVTPLVEEHIAAVYRYALRLAGRADVAEELAQETMLRAWRHRARLREPRAARLWLLRIAGNLWTDQLRRKRFRPQALEAEPPCPGPSPGRAAGERENVQRALAAMDELPPRQRQVMYLATCEGLSHAEVAEVLGIDEGAVKSNLSLARRELRRRLKDVYDEVCGRRACEKK